jgi:prolipoprotein diacylglyceryl transferase
MDGIYFPGVGISFPNVPSGITIFGFEIKFYAIIITLGFILAGVISQREARLTGQKDEDYLDFLIVMVLPVIVGARLYYVIFNPERFFVKGAGVWATFLKIINIRNGGLAIYGGLIAGTITAIIFAKKKGLTMALMWDTVSMGVLVGQIMGRWGNFFNREVFGEYTSSMFRMAIPYGYYGINGAAYMMEKGIITEKMLDNPEIVNGVQCITVHPTFLYEGLLNFILLLFILFYRKHKKFDGEVGLIYMAGYGLCRFFVEAIRTDSLMLGPFKVSQVVALVCVILGAALIILNRKWIASGKEPKLHPYIK